jgi:hypothetical protein
VGGRAKFGTSARAKDLSCDSADTLAMGIVVITIHSAEVKAADIGGTSGPSRPSTQPANADQSGRLLPTDPYVTVSLAKFGKPLFSTRIATKETKPVWEATTAVLIRPEAFRVKERIALRECTLSWCVRVV